MRSVAPTLALVVLAAACSGGGDAAPTTTAAAPATSVAPTATFTLEPADFSTGWRAVELPGAGSSRSRAAAVTRAGARLVAVGSDGDGAAVWISSGGASWERLADTPAFAGAATVDVVPGGPGLIAVGGTLADGVVLTERAVVWLSEDGGGSWERVDHDSFEGARMTAVAAGGPGVVAVGTDGRNVVVWTSEDGRDWQRVPDPDRILAGAMPNGLAATGQGFVLLGADEGFDGAAWISPDGVSWRRVPVGSGVFNGSPVWGAADQAGRLVAVGQTLAENGAAVWLSGGDPFWDRVPLDESLVGASMLGVAAGPGGFVAHGLGPDDAATLWSSLDGLAWERLAPADDPFANAVFLRDLLYDGQGLVAVGGSLDGAAAWVWSP